MIILALWHFPCISFLSNDCGYSKAVKSVLLHKFKGRMITTAKSTYFRSLNKSTRTVIYFTLKNSICCTVCLASLTLWLIVWTIRCTMIVEKKLEEKFFQASIGSTRCHSVVYAIFQPAMFGNIDWEKSAQPPIASEMRIVYLKINQL